MYSIFSVLSILTLAALWIGQVYTVEYFLISNDSTDLAHHSQNQAIISCEKLVLAHHVAPSKHSNLEASLNQLFQNSYQHRNGKFNPLRHSKLVARVDKGDVNQIYLHGQLLPSSDCHLPLIKQQIESTIQLYLKDEPYLIFYNGQPKNFTEVFQLK